MGQGLRLNERERKCNPVFQLYLLADSGHSLASCIWILTLHLPCPTVETVSVLKLQSPNRASLLSVALVRHFITARKVINTRGEELFYINKTHKVLEFMWQKPKSTRGDPILILKLSILPQQRFLTSVKDSCELGVFAVWFLCMH